MYPLLLQQQEIKPKHFPAEMLKRIPYYGRGCAAGMPLGYVMATDPGCWLTAELTKEAT